MYWPLQWTSFLLYELSLLQYCFEFHWILVFHILLPSFCLLWLYFALIFLDCLDGRLVYWFETFLFYTVSTLCYKFRFHTSAVSHKFLYVVFSFSLTFFFNFLGNYCWPKDYVEVVFLVVVFQMFRYFLVAFYSWFLVWFHCDFKNTFHSFKYFKLVDICFMAQEMVYLIDRSMAIGKKIILHCWIVYFVKCQLNPGGLMILFSSSITLQIFCRAVLLVTERGVF